ncbi:MAG TPA: branched-chain amino acid ABC transporter substrate-binding protein [Candidatus Limnocylindrales bacterium]|nr:branched-chain amino acid ABC transporter substrate-binding protein [Candidatus Limnocylindrales bacterium]
MKLARVGALAAAAVIAFSACTTAPGTTSAPSGSGGTAAQPDVCKDKKGTSSSEVHIYSALPRQGSNKAQTDAMVESIKEIIDGTQVGDFTIKYTDLDDSSAAAGGDWDGAVAQANATTAANDPDAMVFIGHFNSGAAKLTIPILNNACLVMISPANTYPGLTTAVEGVTEPGEPDSYYPNGYRNYTRVISTDNKQGGAGAAWAKELGATKAYVLDDTQVYGKGLARSWALSAQELGIEVISGGTSEGFDAKATDYNALAQKIKDSGADFIYIGSITGQNTGKLWKDLRAAMPDIGIMSGDGVFEKAWYDGAGDAGNGTYLTFGGVGPNEQTSEAGKQWVADFKEAHNGEDPPVYGIYGAAAAQVAVDALNRAAVTNDRWEVLKAVFETKDFESYLGTFSVKPDGDVTLAEATGYQVVDSWPPEFEKVLAAPD